MREEGLSVDVASGGELHMALAAGFDPARIHMHGNNKTEAELRYAFDSGVGHLILDSFDEIELADRLLDRPQKVLIRVTPGIKPSTHDYVQTGQLDSKFGFGLADRLAERAVERVRESTNLELVGLHAHIGSQIFELEPYVKAIEVIADFCDSVDLAARAAQRRRRPRASPTSTPTSRPRSRTTSRSRSAACSGSSTRRRGSWSSRAARWSATPASPRTASGPSRRSRACAPTSPSTAGCPTTCGRCSTAPATRR